MDPLACSIKLYLLSSLNNWPIKIIRQFAIFYVSDDISYPSNYKLLCTSILIRIKNLNYS